MSQYPSCKHEHSNPNFECHKCLIENKLAALKAICAELKNALGEANDYDASAEQFNTSSFKHRRKEFDSLTIRAGRILREMEKETE